MCVSLLSFRVPIGFCSRGSAVGKARKVFRVLRGSIRHIYGVSTSSSYGAILKGDRYWSFAKRMGEKWGEVETGDQCRTLCHVGEWATLYQSALVGECTRTFRL